MTPISIHRLVGTTVTGIALMTGTCALAGAGGKLDFNRDIKPLLSDTCFKCHGPDKSAGKAGLRLDLREEALKAPKSGKSPVVPGQPEASGVVRRIFFQ